MSSPNNDHLLEIKEISEDVTGKYNPSTFEQYVGQKEIKEKLHMYATASKQRAEPLDHVLLFGPPGLGKTTLAKVIAHHMDVPVRVTSAPVIERTGDLVALLSSLESNEVFFIDEIHRLPKTVEEILYAAMEHFCVDMIVGQGAGAQSIRLPIKPFTLIGATTKTGLISGPLQTRFGIVERLDYYTPDELSSIVLHEAAYVSVSITPEAAGAIGKRARGTPRIVKRMFRRVRDFAQVNNHTLIDNSVVNKALSFLGIDHDGLDKLDRQLLIHIIQSFNGGPVGLETLAAITGEDRDTLEDVCEPYLIRQGLLQKTPRGRQIPAQKMPYLKNRLLGNTDPFQQGLFDHAGKYIDDDTEV